MVLSENAGALFVAPALTIPGSDNALEPQMSVRATITTQFEAVAREQKRALAPLTDDLRLLQSGLDSLSFALIVARLEEALDFDPFESAEDLKFPVTFGDFVKLYENHPNGGAA
jgi:acyl carrier protein